MLLPLFWIFAKGALEMNNLVSAVMSLDCVMLCDVMVGNLTCIGLANLYIH